MRVPGTCAVRHGLGLSHTGAYDHDLNHQLKRVSEPASSLRAGIKSYIAENKQVIIAIDTYA